MIAEVEGGECGWSQRLESARLARDQSGLGVYRLGAVTAEGGFECGAYPGTAFDRGSVRFHQRGKSTSSSPVQLPLMASPRGSSPTTRGPGLS